MTAGTAPEPWRPKRRKRRERYKLLKLLGQGGMGSVYKAEDLELDRIVALKLLHPMLAGDEKWVSLLKREVVVASRVTHPNIVRTYDIVELHGVVAISMALVEGDSLSSVLKRDGALALPRVLHFTRQICGALGAAHQAGVVHRDLKPANLLIDCSGSIYVSDFGMAHSTGSDSSEAQLGASERPGTPRYMSPEQYHSLPLDGRSDLFALGLILYEMLVGRPLEVDLKANEAVAVDRKTQRPVAIPPSVPAAMQRVILRCLQTSPDQRYRSAGEVVADLPGRALDTAAAVETIPEPESGVAHAAAPEPPKREWRLRTAGLAAIVLLAVSGVAWLVAGRPGSGEQGLAAAPRRTFQEEYQDGMNRLQGQASLANVEAAVRAFERATKLNPTHGPALVGLARSSLRLGQMRSDHDRILTARSAIAEAARLGQVNSSNTLLRAEIDIAAGDPGSALKAVSELLKKGPGTDEIYRTRARALMASGKLDQAVASAREAVGLNSDFWMNHHVLGLTLRSAGRPAEAAAAFRQVVAKEPQGLVGHANLGAALVDSGEFIAAIPVLEEALRLSPTAIRYTNLGTALLYAGSCFSAVELFQKAVQLDPDNDLHTGNLADAYRCAGRSDEAASAYRRALELSRKARNQQPGDLTIAGRHALYLAKSGEMDEAEVVMDAALKKAPSNPALLHHQAVLLVHRNQYGRARMTLDQAIKNGYPKLLAAADPELQALRGLGKHQ